MAGERHYPVGMLVCRFFHPPIKERSKCFLEKRVDAHCRLLGEFAHGASFSKSVFQFKFRLLMVRCGHKRAVVASAHELERASLFIVKRGDRYQRPLYQVLALDGASGVPARELGSERNGAVLAPVELGTFAAGKGDRPTHQSGITSKLNLTGLHGDASQFDALVSAVDFPSFVTGLIEGVFGAIVNASIEQMHAYERLLASVAKTVKQFLKAGIDNTVARDVLMQEFAGILCWQGSQAASGRGRRLVLCPHAKRASLVRIAVTIGLKKRLTDLNDAQEELRLVAATRRRIARNRQQLLATTLLMGINRIVVTDGSINARTP